MTKSIALACALTIGISASAFAQTTQTSVVGASGDPSYPVQVTASNGIVYKCERDVENRNGVPVRVCVRDELADADQFLRDNSALKNGLIAAGVVALVLLLASSIDGDDSAPTFGG